MALSQFRSGSRLWMEGPQVDESISSMFDRAGALLSLSRDAVLNMLTTRAGMANLAPPADWDNPPAVVLGLLADALDIDKTQLESHRIEDGPARVSPSARSSYCPICFDEDVIAGRTVYFRRSWSWLAGTFCSIHGTVLIAWRAQYHWSGRRVRAAFVPSFAANTESATRARASLHNLAELTRKFGLGSSWPGLPLSHRMMQWESGLSQLLRDNGSPSKTDDPKLNFVGNLVMLLGLNLGPFTDRPPAGLVTPSFDYWAHNFDRGPGLPSVGYDPDWAEFRNLDPWHRRSAFFMAAACLEDGWPVTEVLALSRQLESRSWEWWNWVVRPAVGIFLQAKLEEIQSHPGFMALIGNRLVARRGNQVPAASSATL